MKLFIKILIVLMLAVPSFTAPAVAADFTLVIDVEDARVQDTIDSLNWHYGQVEDPPESDIFRDRTNAELKAKLKAGVKNSLDGIYIRWERFKQTQAAIPAPPDIQ